LEPGCERPYPLLAWAVTDHLEMPRGRY
jgi:hypothetical protein